MACLFFFPLFFLFRNDMNYRMPLFLLPSIYFVYMSCIILSILCLQRTVWMIVQPCSHPPLPFASLYLDTLQDYTYTEQ